MVRWLVGHLMVSTKASFNFDSMILSSLIGFGAEIFWMEYIDWAI